MLKAGELRHRITLQRFVEVLDSNGEVQQDATTGEIARDWETVASVWAKIRASSVREFIAAGVTQSEVTVAITIRQRSDVDNGWRALHGAKIYNILGVLPDPDSGLEYQSLPCSEGLNDGR
jgi:SPP1 family predicted phage head-tail adaptor